MTWLLDINSLISLFDRKHVHHDRAHASLEQFCRNMEHTFWLADISFLSIHESIPGELLQGHNLITDLYLVALASYHKGALVTFDRRLAHAIAGTAYASAISLIE